MHKPYLEVFGHLPDFEVTYRIFSPEEGGRKTPVFQGIRWDFTYEDYPSEGFMIYPEIIDVNTKVAIEAEVAIPDYGIATMWILNSRLRGLHQKRIKLGTRGYFVEGPRKVGVCEVTRIIGLFSNPIE